MTTMTIVTFRMSRKRVETVEKAPLASLFGHSRASAVRSDPEGDNA